MSAQNHPPPSFLRSTLGQLWGTLPSEMFRFMTKGTEMEKFGEIQAKKKFRKISQRKKTSEKIFEHTENLEKI